MPFLASSRAIHAALTAGLLLTAAPSNAQNSQPLTFAQALQRALSSNPKLAGADRDIDVSVGRTLQSRAIPNPELTAEFENIAGSGPYRGTASLETTLTISQLIELGGKRDARISAATAELDSVRWQRRAVRLEVLSEAATAFINVAAEQRRIQILDEQVTALDGLRPLLQRRVEAGASAQPEITRAQVAADLVRVDREKARASLASAKRELALIMGEAEPRFARVSGNFGDARPTQPFRTISDAIDANPQLMRWTAVRAQRDAELLSARLKAVPDLRAGVGYRRFRESGDNAMTLGVTMTVPLWDQNQGDISAARSSLEKVQSERAANKAALLLVAGRAFDAVGGATQELNLLRTAVIPNLRGAAQAIEEGYGQGRFTLFELLDMRATLTESLLREQEALRTYHVAIATIESLVDRPFAYSQGSRR